MKKIFVVLLLCILTAFLLSEPIYNWLSNGIVDFIAVQFEKEENERIKKSENGDIIRGKDTVLIWSNKYDITKHMGEKSLCIYFDDSSAQIIDKIKKYSIRKDKLFILSEEGYVVIDKDKMCRVYITVSEDEFINGYCEDEKGNRIYQTRKVENEYITYLSGFGEFSVEEQNVLHSL